MFHSTTLNRLPAELQAILFEYENGVQHQLSLEKKFKSGLRVHGLIPDDGITILRISDGAGFSRDIDLTRTVMETAHDCAQSG